MSFMELRTGAIEIIERKGMGHPDTVCDLLAERMIRKYAEFIGTAAGGLPNGSFDKVAISGGEAVVQFGHGKALKPPTVYLFGKAMRLNGSNQYIKPLFNEVVESVVGDVFGRKLTGKDPQGVNLNTIVDINSGVGAEHHPSFYTVAKDPVSDLWDYPLSNDTVACAGWYPFTRHERMTVELENYINSTDFKADFPETGTDVKVLTQRLGTHTVVTLCVPFIAESTPTSAYYEARKNEILQKVRDFVENQIGSKATIYLNTKDIPGTGYLTLFGTAFDKGDNGMTGRGNRYPGFISLGRPSGVEATSGKNPFNHSGKIYTILAFDLAKLIYDSDGTEVVTYITAFNGGPLDIPYNITVVHAGRDVTSRYRELIEVTLHKLSAPRYLQSQAVLYEYKNCYDLL